MFTQLKTKLGFVVGVDVGRGNDVLYSWQGKARQGKARQGHFQ